MKASTQLIVPREMRVKIELDMTVDEMRGLLEATKDVRSWPVGSLREILSKSLIRATAAYDSPLEVTP